VSSVTEQPDWQIHGDERPLPPLLGEVKELAIAELHRRLAGEGYPDIRPGHGCVFRFIKVEGARLTDLAELAGMTKQAVGEVVADLERLGYVERVPDPEDRRAKIIRLTGRGWEAERTARRIFGEIEQRWTEEIGQERMAQLRETLELVIESQRAATVG
jgi:DNA-binding MarR family transcriptional regulator